MKLVFVGPTYPFRGGIARYGTYLLAELMKHYECRGLGFNRLYPAFLFPGQEQLETDPMPAQGAQAERLLHFAKWSTWKRAAEEIEAFQPEGVVLSWWVSFWALHTGWLARRIARSHRVIFLCHNVLPHESHFFDQPLTRWALRPANGFIVHSQDDQGALKKLFPNVPVKRREHPVFPLDADLNLSQPEARLRLGISGRMLLYFGFIRHYKGLDVAIEALKYLDAEYRDVTLWVAGEFWDDKRRYLQQVESLSLKERVHIEGVFLPEAELALRLAACDGVILPYRSATGSGVLGSAYAAHKPVIATRTGCFKEMVLPGETGLLCEPGDPQSLARAIQEFYAGPGPGRFQNGVARAAKQFTWGGILNAIDELIHAR